MKCFTDTYYLLNKCDVSNRNLVVLTSLSLSEYVKAQCNRTFKVNKFFIIPLFALFLLATIGQWVFRNTNALELANQSAYHIGHKCQPCNKLKKSDNYKSDNTFQDSKLLKHDNEVSIRNLSSLIVAENVFTYCSSS